MLMYSKSCRIKNRIISEQDEDEDFFKGSNFEGFLIRIRQCFFNEF